VWATIGVVWNRRVVVAVAVTMSLAACGGNDDDSSSEQRLDDSATIEYEYGDASVPPEYQRNYSLSVTREQVHVVVDSYGDVLYDDIVPLPGAAWDVLTDASDPVFALTPDEPDGGCAGGTTRTLRVSDQDGTVLDLDFGVCGGVNEDAAKALDAYMQPVLDAIPKWDSIVEAQ
jgi:hypothetical protein